MFPSKQLAIVELCIFVMYFITFFRVLKHDEKVSIFLDTSLFTFKVLIYFDFKNDIGVANLVAGFRELRI